MQISTDTTPRPPAAPSRPTAGIGADFQTFLRMLTAQLRNQDPLNPMEATDFAVQLATFAGVEQQTRTNALLETLADAGGLGGLSRYAGWIGMEARVPGTATFAGTPLVLELTPAPGADSATLVVTDAAGREVARNPVPLAGGTMDWAGLGADGAPLPPGRYAFALESRRGDAILSSEPVPVYAIVREARLRADGTAEIVLSGGVAVAPSDVTALRRPGG